MQFDLKVGQSPAVFIFSFSCTYLNYFRWRESGLENSLDLAEISFRICNLIYDTMYHVGKTPSLILFINSFKMHKSIWLILVGITLYSSLQQSKFWRIVKIIYKALTSPITCSLCSFAASSSRTRLASTVLYSILSVNSKWPSVCCKCTVPLRCTKVYVYMTVFIVSYVLYLKLWKLYYFWKMDLCRTIKFDCMLWQKPSFFKWMIFLLKQRTKNIIVTWVSNISRLSCTWAMLQLLEVCK